MSQATGQLTPRQREAALLEAAGADRSAAAEATGVSVKTISRWRSGDAYRAAVRDLQATGPDSLDAAGALRREIALGATEATRAVRHLLRTEMQCEAPRPEVITAIARVLVAKAPNAGGAQLQRQPAAVKISISDEGVATVLDGNRRAPA